MYRILKTAFTRNNDNSLFIYFKDSGTIYEADDLNEAMEYYDNIKDELDGASYLVDIVDEADNSVLVDNTVCYSHPKKEQDIEKYIVRGTTLEYVFHTPKDLRDAVIYVTYAQNHRTILEKTGKELIVENDKIQVNLTQEETLKFSTKHILEIQYRYVFSNGEAGASEVMLAKVKDVLKDGKIIFS